MQQSLQSGKRIFSAAVAAATIAFSVGLAGIVAPMTAHGASAGDLIKGSLSTVYYYGYDGMRYTFSNEKTYMTWYSNFSDVTTISDSALADIELGGNAVYRPGSRWIKIQSDPKVYAVANDGMIHWIESEAVAQAFAGSDWASYVEDVPDAFFVDYTVGASLMTAEAYEGMLAVDGGVYYTVADGETRSLSSAARTANNLQSRFFLDGSGIDTSALSEGAAITGSVTALTDAAQTVDFDGGDVTTGDLSIKLSSSTANGVSLPQGANGVEVASFDVKAGAEDASLEALTLSLIGVGAVADIENVYLYEGVTRLTEARSVNSATRQVTFSSIDLDVDAGDTRTITVRIETSATAVTGDTFGFSIASADDVDATGDVSGTFPAAGDIFTFTGADVGTAVITKSGTITNPTVGEQDAIIGKFKIASATEAATVNAITLKIDNASDHSDFKLWDDTVLLASGSASGDDVTFDLSDDAFEIADGSSNIFSVSADIGGEADDDIKVYVDNDVDVEVIGGDYGFGLQIDTGTSGTYDSADAGDADALACSTASDDCSWSEIEGGDITIVSSGPTASDIQVDSQDQVLMNFSITSSEEVTVKDMVFTVASSTSDLYEGSETGLQDLKIVNTDTGAVVMGPEEMDTSSLTTQNVAFGEDFVVEAGETLNLALWADVNSTVDSDAKFLATFVTGSLVVEDAAGDTIVNANSVVPSGSIVGFTQTAKASSLVIALASTPGDVETVDGAQDVLVNAFTFVAGTASDLDVSSVMVSIYSSEDLSTYVIGDGTDDVNDFISSCYLTDAAGTMLGTAKSPISNGDSFTVTNMGWNLSAGETETLKIYCNFLNPSDGVETNGFAFDIVAASDIIVTDGENDITATGVNANDDTTPVNEVSVFASGSLAATVSSNTPNADFILTSSSDVHVASYTFTATREDFEVKTITISEEEAEDDISADSSAYANNISLVTISYPAEDGTMYEKSAAMTGNEVTFNLAGTALQPYMYVPVGEPQDVDVYVNVPLTARDSGGSATSNEEIRLSLKGDNTDEFIASGVGSGIEVDGGADSGDLATIGDDRFVSDGVATFVVRETKPTLSISSSSPAGDASPSVLEALRFNVAASSNENVVLEKITFKVTASDNAATTWDYCDINQDDATGGADLDQSSFSFYEVTGGTLTQLDTADSDWTLSTSTGVTCVSATDAELGFVTIDLPTAELVTKGGTATYAVKVDASGASSLNNDTLRLDIVTDLSAGFITTTASQLVGAQVLAAATRDITVATPGDFLVGDVICMDTVTEGVCEADEERMLVVEKAGSVLTVVRGYMNSPVVNGDINGQEILRSVGGLLWQDDGSVAIGTTEETMYGAYMIDYLDLDGGTLVF